MKEGWKDGRMEGWKDPKEKKEGRKEGRRGEERRRKGKEEEREKEEERGKEGKLEEGILTQHMSQPKIYFSLVGYSKLT